MRKLIIRIFVISLFAALTSTSFAASDDADDLFEMSIEELMEVDLVVSGSRTEQKMSFSSVPITVITAEDIHYSGLSDIGDILQFATGIDMLPLTRMSSAIGVRGMHEAMSDRVLTLIDGRPADSALFGGQEFYRLPVMLEDIERIEIIRGPGGALWGANAFNGVINIITKDPKDTQGMFVSSRVNEFGDTWSHFRWGSKAKDWVWRFSAGYEDVEDSDDAGVGKYELGNQALGIPIGYSSYTANDYARDWRFDSEATRNISEATKMSIGLGISHGDKGDFEIIGYYPHTGMLLETYRGFAKIDHEFDDGSSGYLQWTGNYDNSNISVFGKWSTLVNDFEAQYNFKPHPDHNVSVGGNVRAMRIDTHRNAMEDLNFRGEPYDEQLAGIFAIDRWKVSDKWELEGQIRGDWYSETQTDWATRMSALYTMNRDRERVLRFSVSKAFRTPLASMRHSSTSRVNMVPFGGFGFALNIIVADDLDNEEIVSYEIGYTDKLSDNLRLKLNTFYQDYKDLVGWRTIPDPLSAGRMFYQPDNIAGAKMWGGELELEYRDKKKKISGWYAYHGFNTEQGDQNVRAYDPAKHKAGLTCRFFFDKGLTLNTNYKYTDTTESAAILGSPGASHRFDVSIAKEFAKGNGEFMVGVSDILNNTRGPNYLSGQVTAHEIPGRTFFTRVQLRF
ncbi:MAG: TonB-dependent receptor [Anaerohalosphaera sp.]|nr:TonB-dependent receptor [Anaerohalosphaera sp.]